MDPLTYRVLAVVGDGEHHAFLLRLLDGDATVRQLRERPEKGNAANKYLRRMVSQPTAHRSLTRLADIGLAGSGAQPKTYRLTHPRETRRFMEAANRLAMAIGRARLAEDEALGQALAQGKGLDGQSEE